MADHPKPFDPTNPFDIAAESARKRVAVAMITILKSREMVDLPRSEALHATIAGSLTGLVGCLLTQVQPASRAELMAVIAELLPKAQAQAETMLEVQGHG